MHSSNCAQIFCNFFVIIITALKQTGYYITCIIGISMFIPFLFEKSPTTAH